jgi:hypothetical protein
MRFRIDHYGGDTWTVYRERLWGLLPDEFIGVEHSYTDAVHRAEIAAQYPKYVEVP